MSIAPTEPDLPPPGNQVTDPLRTSRDKSVVDSQPRASRPMTSAGIGGDKYAFRVPVMADGLRAWSFGLFDCFSDLPTCVLSTFCCCYVYSRNKQRFVHLETQGTPLREPVGRYNQDCISWCLLQGCCSAGCGLQAVARSHVRRRYGIRGDAINDVLVGGFCGPCQLVQEHREIQLEESSFYGV